MVQTDLSQLSRECNSWKETLRSYRSEFTDFRLQLQDMISRGAVPKNALPQVEHYSNQFDIQLANINHLKHAIKEHEKMASWDKNGTNTEVNEILGSTHENLQDQYASLEHTLSGLKQEFQAFSGQTA
jgi:chromosome segregation ATPase